MVTAPNSKERRALPSSSEIEDGKHFQAISQYCFDKAASYDSIIELFNSLSAMDGHDRPLKN